MAKDLEENPFAESEELDFLSDDEDVLFGKPEISVYNKNVGKHFFKLQHLFGETKDKTKEKGKNEDKDK